MPIFLVLKRRVRHLLAEFRTSCWQNAIFDEMLLTIYSVFVQTYQQVKAQTLFHKKWEAHSVRATMSLSLPMSLSLSLGEAYFFKGGRQLQLYNSWVWLCLRLWARHNFSEMEGIYSYTTSEGYDDFLKERGVPWIGRKLIIAAPVQLEVGYNESGEPPKKMKFF